MSIYSVIGTSVLVGYGCYMLGKHYSDSEAKLRYNYMLLFLSEAKICVHQVMQKVQEAEKAKMKLTKAAINEARDKVLGVPEVEKPKPLVPDEVGEQIPTSKSTSNTSKQTQTDKASVKDINIQVGNGQMKQLEKSKQTQKDKASIKNIDTQVENSQKKQPEKKVKQSQQQNKVAGGDLASLSSKYPVLIFPDIVLPCEVDVRAMMNGNMKRSCKDTNCHLIHNGDTKNLSLIRMIKFINKAQKEILILMYHFTLPLMGDVILELLNARKKCKVIILASYLRDQMGDQIPKLIKHNRVQVYEFCDLDMALNNHVVIDGEYVIHGNLDWTASSVLLSCSSVTLADKDRALASAFQKNFKQLCSRKDLTKLCK